MCKSKLCPLCRSDTRRKFWKNGYCIRECRSCHYRFTETETGKDHADQVYGDDYFFGGGDGYRDYLSEEKILIKHGRQYGRLLKKYMSPGEVLDVGSAAGFIAKGLQDCGWKVKGIEPNVRLAEYAKKRFRIQVESTTLEQLEDGRQYDLISMIQVISHVYDLRRALEAAAAHTKHSGFWLIETWNRASLIAKFLGRHWHEYSPPSVLRWFSIDGLSRLLEQYNFIEVAHGKPSKKLNGKHLKSLINHRLKDKPVSRPASRLFDLVPDCLAIPYPAFDLFWILLQKK